MRTKENEIPIDFAGWAEPPRTDGQPRAYCVKNFENHAARLRLGEQSLLNSLLNTKP